MASLADEEVPEVAQPSVIRRQVLSSCVLPPVGWGIGPGPQGRTTGEIIGQVYMCVYGMLPKETFDRLGGVEPRTRGFPTQVPGSPCRVLRAGGQRVVSLSLWNTP